MKTLIIGQAPSRKSNPREPWSTGVCARRLWRWFDVDSREELLEMADVFNAVPYYPGSNGTKGDKLPKGEELSKIRERVIRKIRRGGYKKIIVVGKFVDGLIRNYLRRKMIMTLTIPHPSGANISANGVDGTVGDAVKIFMMIGEKR